MVRPKRPGRSAADYLPKRQSLRSLREAAEDCRGCDLYRYATQTVFGEGAARGRAMLVGEEPGDSEDKLGHPFVGPAGKLLHKALRAAGIMPADVYLTNAVKHFKFVWRGKRRIHVKPKRAEVRACLPWLEAEMSQVRPRLIVALGATAAQALIGTNFRLTKHRGEFVSSPLTDVPILATVHPSAILRAPDQETRRAEMAQFVADLKIVKRAIKKRGR